MKGGTDMIIEGLIIAGIYGLLGAGTIAACSDSPPLTQEDEDDQREKSREMWEKYNNSGSSDA